MRYSVKLIIKYAAETGETLLEESILMLDAASFDEAYEKAERYAREAEIECTYENVFGRRVSVKIASFSDCFAVYDEDGGVTEVYSSMKRCSDELPEAAVFTVLDASAEREQMLPFREAADPNDLDELNMINETRGEFHA